MSISIEVHPLTVLNVTDHLTRAKYMSTADKPFRVVGALLGKQEGRVLEIVNTVEIAFRFAPEADGGIKIDDQFCQQRLEAYKKMWPDLDCIGWYSSSTNGDQPSEADMIVHKHFQRFAENPFYLVLNPDSQEAMLRKILPLFLFELNTQTGSQPQFVKLDYSLAASDSERIAVDHVAKASDPNQKTSKLSQSMIASLNALKLLRRKVRFLIDIVKNSPEVRQNQDFMRKLNQICTQLPITQRENFNQHAFSEYSDVAAINLLASVTKGFEMMNELLEDFKIFMGRDFGIADLQDGGMLGFEGRMDEETLGMLGLHPSMSGHGGKIQRKGFF